MAADAGKLGEAFVSVRYDLSDMNRETSSLGRTLTKKFTGIGRTAGIAFASGFAIGATIIGGLAATIGRAFLGAYSDAAEIGSKFSVVFKDTQADAEAFANLFATRVGRSITDVRAQMAEFGDTFVPMGFDRTEATELSKALSVLTADLASFSNMADKDVSDALKSTMIGNHENALRFGVIITENTLNAKLMAMGIKDGTKAATEQQKVMARLAMIYEGTTDSHGDAIRTSDGLANSLKSLSGAAKDSRAMLGSVMGPAVAQIAQFMAEMLRNFNEHKAVFELWGAKIGNIIRNLLENLRRFVAQIGDFLGSIMPTGEVESTFSGIAQGWTNLFSVLELATEDLGLAWQALGAGIKMVLLDVSKFAIQQAREVTSVIANATVKQFEEGAASQLAGLVKKYSFMGRFVPGGNLLTTAGEHLDPAKIARGRADAIDNKFGAVVQHFDEASNKAASDFTDAAMELSRLQRERQAKREKEAEENPFKPILDKLAAKPLTQVAGAGKAAAPAIIAIDQLANRIQTALKPEDKAALETAVATKESAEILKKMQMQQEQMFGFAKMQPGLAAGVVP